MAMGEAREEVRMVCERKSCESCGLKDRGGASMQCVMYARHYVAGALTSSFSNWTQELLRRTKEEQ